jgi:hypothetical protein
VKPAEIDCPQTVSEASCRDCEEDGIDRETKPQWLVWKELPLRDLKANGKRPVRSETIGLVGLKDFGLPASEAP